MSKVNRCSEYIDKRIKDGHIINDKNTNEIMNAFFSGYDAAVADSVDCSGCIHEPKKLMDGATHEICESCSRLYTDMHSKHVFGVGG